MLKCKASNGELARAQHRSVAAQSQADLVLFVRIYRRHWFCLTKQTINNMKKKYSDDIEDFDGWDELDREYCER